MMNNADTNRDRSVQAGKRPTVFISYAREDERARGLRTKYDLYLKDQGFAPFWDEKDIEYSKPWRDQIKSYINRCDTMIVLMTEAAAESTWVLAEVIWGLARDKEPLILLHKDTKMPAQLDDLQAAALTGEFVDDERMMSRVLAELHKRVDRIPRPEVTPLAERPEQDLAGNLTVDLLYRSLLEEVIRQAQPTVSSIEKFIYSFRHFEYDPRTLENVIQTELKSRGSKLIAWPPREADVFADSHREQANLGKLLGQVATNQNIQYKNLTGPIPVSGYSIIASKFHLTQDTFAEYQTSQRSSSGTREAPGDRSLPWVVPQVHHSELDALLQEVDRLADWLRDRLRSQGELRGTVRLPTIDEWRALAHPNAGGWTYERVRACNVESPQVRRPTLSSVGSYPASASMHGCEDVIGNVWDLCIESLQHRRELRIMGWSHKSHLNKILHGWDEAFPLFGGLAPGDPVGIRFVIQP